MSIEQAPEANGTGLWSRFREGMGGMDTTTALGVAVVDLSFAAGITDSLISPPSSDLGSRIIEYGVAVPADAALAAFGLVCLVHGVDSLTQRRSARKQTA